MELEISLLLLVTTLLSNTITLSSIITSSSIMQFAPIYTKLPIKVALIIEFYPNMQYFPIYTDAICSCRLKPGLIKTPSFMTVKSPIFIKFKSLQRITFEEITIFFAMIFFELFNMQLLL